MRLLNIKTFELEEFNDGQIPPYVTLSHTWTDGEELSLQEWSAALLKSKGKLLFGKNTDRDFFIQSMRSALSDASTDKRQGFDKIVHFMNKAQEYEVEFCWADTVCIDKTNSVELSEAVNSMYRIYRECKACVAYLVDIFEIDFPHIHLVKSIWFTRGWTLQELIAPRKLTFFNHKWETLGDKTECSDAIEKATGIPSKVLEDGITNDKSIAQRMSWASKRETSRSEDLAYCLLGIFDINMPLIYGEGAAKAFTRLQQEIIKNSDDDSIFAWTSLSSSFSTYRGLLARSPSEFAASGSASFSGSKHDEPFQATNKGLKIQFNGRADPSCAMEFIVTLETTLLTNEPELPRRAIGMLSKKRQNKKNAKIRLRRLSHNSSQYVRVHCHDLLSAEPIWALSAPMEMRTIYVRDKPSIPVDHRSSRARGINCWWLGGGIRLTVLRVWPPEIDSRIVQGEHDSSLQILFPERNINMPQGDEVKEPVSTSDLPSAIVIKLLVEAEGEEVENEQDLGLFQVTYNPSETLSALDVANGEKMSPLEVKFAVAGVDRDDCKDLSTQPATSGEINTYVPNTTLVDDEFWLQIED